MKTGKAMFLAVAIVLPVTAGADDLRDEMLRCAQLRDPQVRLACYDALAAVSASGERKAISDDESPTGEGLPRTPEPAPVTSAAPSGSGGEKPESDRSLTERFFGMLPGGGDVNKMESRVVGEVKNLRGGTRFTLENGQVWQQTEKTNRNYRATNPKVEIKEGFMNSYLMRLEGLNARIRVRRVK